MKDIITRKFLDPQTGVVTTYLPLTTTAELIEVSTTTLHRWLDSGVLRAVIDPKGKRLGGHKIFVAVIDAAMLKSLPRTRALELGIRKTSDQLRAYSRRKYRDDQASTAPADNSWERWTDYEVAQLITAVEQRVPMREIAKTLGRTYAAVNDMTERLRATGDLPCRPEDDGRWRRLLPIVLSGDELAAFEEVS